MSKATKRKHVAKEVLNDFILPEENQQIVKVLAGRGNNLHEVETASKDTFLVSMPTKFRRNVWIKRGDYVIVQPIEEGDRVKAEILTILYKDQIKYIQEQGKWPAAFEAVEKSKDNVMISSDLLPPSDSESDNSDVDCTVMNINRQQAAVYEESDSESDS